MGKTYNIEEAKTDDQVLLCWPVMKALRPHLEYSKYLEQFKLIQKEGYKLMYIEEEGKVASIMGYRIVNFFFSGKTFYVDDLCTLETNRGKGYGGALLEWGIEKAKSENCKCFTLDSGYTRNDAHRLYLNKGLKLDSHHFHLNL